MKSLSGIATQFGLAIVIGLIGAAAVSAEENPPATNPVVISDGSIVIPATEISKDDQKAMNQILKQFDKSLYKIETYENGELKKTRGELADVMIDKQLTSQIAADVKKRGFTQFAVQVANGNATPSGSPGSGGGRPQTNPSSLPPPPPPPNGGATPASGSGTHAQANVSSMVPPPVAGAAATPASGSGTHAQANVSSMLPKPVADAAATPASGSGTHAQANVSSMSPPPPPPLPLPPMPPTGPLGGANRPQVNPNAITPTPAGSGDSGELMTRLKAILEKYSKK